MSGKLNKAGFPSTIPGDKAFSGDVDVVGALTAGTIESDATIVASGKISTTVGAAEAARLNTNADDYTKFTLDANGGLVIESVDTAAAAANIAVTADGTFAVTSTGFNLTGAGAITGVTDLSVSNDILLSDAGVVGITGNEVITFNAGGTVDVSGADLTVTGDINTAAWADYGGTSTIVGWASYTNQNIFYKKVGNIVYIAYVLGGTSNATTITFTVPYTAVATQYFGQPAAYSGDNNGTNTTAARVILSPSTANVSCFKDMASGAWTNANTKFIWGSFWYEAV